MFRADEVKIFHLFLKNHTVVSPGMELIAFPKRTNSFFGNPNNDDKMNGLAVRFTRKNTEILRESYGIYGKSIK